MFRHFGWSCQPAKQARVHQVLQSAWGKKNPCALSLVVANFCFYPCNFAWNWEWIRVWKLQIDSFHYSNLISLDVAFPVLARNGFEASHVPKAVSIMLLYTCEDLCFFSSGIPAMSPNLTQRNCNVHKRFLRHIFFLWCVVVVGRASIWIALPLEIKLFESRSHMRSEIEIASYYCCCCCCCYYYYVLVLVRLLLQLNAVPLQLLYWLPPLVRLSLLRHRTSATTVTVLPRLPRSCFITYYYYHHYYYYYYYYYYY